MLFFPSFCSCISTVIKTVGHHKCGMNDTALLEF
jgi:hypothetical protein